MTDGHSFKVRLCKFGTSFEAVPPSCCSHPRDGQFSVQEYALFPRNVHTEDLKTDVLGLPAESFLLHLTPGHTGAATAIILVANTR